MYESAYCDEDAIAKAIAFFDAHRDAAGEARAWWALSWMRGEIGQLVASGEAAQRSLDCARRAGDQTLASQALQLLPYSLASGPANADEVIPRLRQLRAQAATKQTEALVLDCLGYVEAMRGRFAEARPAAEESRGILIDLGNPLDVARCDVFRRAQIEQWAGDLLAAERFARGGCEIMERHGAVGLLTSGLCCLAEVLIA